MFKKSNTDIIPINELTIHPDIVNLLWIDNGKNSNYSRKIKKEKIKINGLSFEITVHGPDEPSLIYTKLPIKKNIDKNNIEKLPYFPSYVEITDEQRRIYWEFLSNPYQKETEIGYVFILYYGLERYLLTEKYEQAFKVILKLRDIHNNKSFQTYSGNALILTAMQRQRADLAQVFMKSIDKEYEFQFSDNLFLICKYSLDIKLTPKDIIRLAKSVEFTNTNYIKKYPDIFLKNLNNSIKKEYKSEEIDLKNLINKTDLKKIRTEDTRMFANISIIDESIKVPVFIEIFKLKLKLYKLLENAHEQTKNELSELRKTGNSPKPMKKENVKKIIKDFDIKTEKELLKFYKENSKNIQNKHFILIQIQDFYYKSRQIDQKYLNECIKYCFEDINLLDNLQKEYRINEEKRINNLTNFYSKKEIQEMKNKSKTFTGRIPAFSRLAIIYEKNKNYNEALKICDLAINYYKKYKLEDLSNDFIERKDKILKKMK